MGIIRKQKEKARSEKVRLEALKAGKPAKKAKKPAPKPAPKKEAPKNLFGIKKAAPKK